MSYFRKSMRPMRNASIHNLHQINYSYAYYWWKMVGLMLDAYNNRIHCYVFMCDYLSKSFYDNEDGICSIMLLINVINFPLQFFSISFVLFYPFFQPYTILSDSVYPILGCHKLFKALYPLQLRCWVYHKQYLIQWRKKMKLLHA